MVGYQSLRSFREDLVAGRTWKEEHTREGLYDMDIVRMYYRIILLCKFTIIPKSCTVNYLSAAKSATFSWFQPGSHQKDFHTLVAP